MHRRVFAWSILAALGIWGCAESVPGNQTDLSGCGNGVLEPGEECDGDAWAPGKNVCPSGTEGITVCNAQCKVDTGNCFAPMTTCGNGLLDAGESCEIINGETQWMSGKGTCPAPMTGTPGCVQCHEVLASFCSVTVETCPSECTSGCNPDGSCKDAACPETCTSGCNPDGSCKAESSECAALGYETCTEPDAVKCIDDNTSAICMYGCWVPDDCTAFGQKCDSARGVCATNCSDYGYQACDVSEENTVKCVDDKTMAVCVDGCWMTDHCADYGKVCKSSGNTASCVLSGDLGCHGNVLVLEEDGKVVSFDCTAVNGVCRNDDCVTAEKISCDGTILTVEDSGKTYTFDCALDNMGCHKDVGCAKDYCNGKSRMKCVDGVCSEIEQCETECINTFDSKVAGTACACSSAQEDQTRCVDSDTMVMCISGQWVEEVCSGGQTCQDNECKNASPCGNGYLDSGEDCDGTTFKEYGISCNKYDKYSAYTGAPSCSDQCRVSMSSCTKKPETEISHWSFTSLNVIKEYTKGDTCSIYGGFTTTMHSNQDGRDAWVLGSWGKATTPDFEDKYLEFDIKEIKDYDALTLSFYAKRKDNGPKNLKIRFKAGDKVEYSEVISLQTKWSSTPYQIKPKHEFVKAASGKLEIRFRGYAQSEETGGTMSISDVVVSGSKI